jgi:hypothetical protein
MPITQKDIDNLKQEFKDDLDTLRQDVQSSDFSINEHLDRLSYQFHFHEHTGLDSPDINLSKFWGGQLVGKYQAKSAFSSNSNVFVAVTNYTITEPVTKNKGVLILYNGFIKNTTLNDYTHLTVYLDGVNLSTGTDSLASFQSGTDKFYNISLMYVTDTLTEDTHTFTLYAKSIGGGTFTIGIADVMSSFIIIQLK